jgi:hypothetical protein
VNRTPQPDSSRPRLNRPQFRSQWQRANAEINALVTMGIKLQALMPSLYEGVTGEAVPDFDVSVEWEEVADAG